jgi:hypothetical protein
MIRERLHLQIHDVRRRTHRPAPVPAPTRAHRAVSPHLDQRDTAATRVIRRNTNRRHMIGDHHGRTAKEQPCWSEPWTRLSARTGSAASGPVLQKPMSGSAGPRSPERPSCGHSAAKPNRHPLRTAVDSTLSVHATHGKRAYSRRYGRSHFAPFIGDRHTEQGSLCVLGRRRFGRNCCAHPPPATRRPERSGVEWSGVGISGIPSLARRDVQHIDDPAPVSVEALTLLRIASHSASVPARPASAVARVAPARLTRAFSGPVTVLPGG